MQTFYDTTFKNLEWETEELPIGEYEGCTFENCSGVDAALKNCKFIKCAFIDCDLSNAHILQSAFQDCSFVNCKLLGLRWEDASDFLFEVRFENCNLSHSSFYEMSIPKTHFLNCNCTGVDFINTDLTSANFENSDLLDCKFDNTNLQKVNFLGALNLVLDPNNNNLKKAKIEMNQLPGLLTQYYLEIH